MDVVSAYYSHSRKDKIMDDMVTFIHTKELSNAEWIRDCLIDEDDRRQIRIFEDVQSLVQEVTSGCRNHPILILLELDLGNLGINTLVDIYRNDKSVHFFYIIEDHVSPKLQEWLREYPSPVIRYPLDPLVLCTTVASIEHCVITRMLHHVSTSIFPDLLLKMIDAIPVPMFCKNADHRFVICNQLYADFLGRPVEEILNARTVDLFPESKALRFDALNDMLLKTGISQSEELEFDHKNGENTVWIVKKSIYRNDEGGIEGIIGLMTEITPLRKMQKKLSQEQRFIRSIINNLPECIYSKDLNGRYTSANVQMLKMLGLNSESEIIGKDNSSLLEPSLANSIAEIESEMVLTKRDLMMREEQWEILGRKEALWFQVTRVLVKDKQGKPRAIIGLNVDISSIRRNQQRLRLLSAAVDAAGNAIFITDRNGKIEYVNRAFSVLNGYSLAEVIGRNPRLLKSGLMDRLYYEEMWQRIGQGKTWRNEVFNKRSDGSIYTGDLTITPVFNRKQEITHYIAICVDITEKKKIRDKLSRIQTAINNANDGVVITDEKGCIVYYNKAFEALTELQQEGHCRMYMSDYIPDRANRESIDCAESTGVVQGWQSELELCTVSDEMIPVLIKGSPVKDNKGSGIGMVYFIHDLRAHKSEEQERLAMELQLRQAQKLEAIGQLAAGIAHEINTPIQYVGDNTRFIESSVKEILDFISRYEKEVEDRLNDSELKATSEALKEELDLEFLQDELPQAFKQSFSGLDHIAKIVNAMRLFSHPNLSDKKAVDLHESIRSAIVISKNEWKYFATVETDFDENIAQITCYPGKLNQCILNMIINASHAIQEKMAAQKSEEKGTITISTALEDSWVIICIKDTGNGIPRAVRSRIFDPFFTTKEVGKGTGQGLSISYDNIVHAHGGSLEFETEEGVGTTFIIKIPLDVA